MTGVHWRDDARAYSCSPTGGCARGTSAGRRRTARATRRRRRARAAADPVHVGVRRLRRARAGERRGGDGHPRALRELFTFDAHADAVSAVHLTTTSTLTTGAADGEVAIWRLGDEGCRAAAPLEGTRRPSSRSMPTARRSSRRARRHGARGRQRRSPSRASPRTSARCRRTRWLIADDEQRRRPPRLRRRDRRRRLPRRRGDGRVVLRRRGRDDDDDDGGSLVSI